MTRKTLMLLAAAGSAALLLAAFGFQLLGYAPCKMCIWQRWPHGLAILAGLAGLVAPLVIFAIAGLLATLTTAVLGGYHTGVERGWWEGPTSCTGGGTDLSAMSGADLLATDIGAGIVMCDEVSWWFLGLSMASWNMILSAVLVLIWARALSVR